MDDRTRERLVSPYYLEMMRLNALHSEEGLQDRVRRVGREVSTDDLTALLREPWRCSVMGAWFALSARDQGVADEVRRALDRSAGSLDAPPLITSAVLLAGREAMSAIADYAERDAMGGWQASGFAGAALEHVGAVAAHQVTDEDRSDLAGMLTIGTRLRDVQ